MRYLYICFLIFLSTLVLAQTNISGVINIYTPVTAITNASCPSGAVITVTSASGFGVGDRILIIQMQGATANQTNTISFGNVTALNNAGNYEFGTIALVSGSNITLTAPLKQSYTISGMVQLVRVPVYTNATVTGTLTPLAWNGTIGGVLVFEVTGTLTLKANINADGMGFRPVPEANRQNGGASCGTADQYYFTKNYYNNTPPVPAGATYSDGRLITGNDPKYGAFKGEGIAAFVTNMEKGKGKWTNGGGGGNVLNAGGGGGGNGGAGGYGGNAFGGDCPSDATRASTRGLGGVALSQSPNTRVFMGGAGGEGHWDGAATTTGSCTDYVTPCPVVVTNNSTIGIGGSNGQLGGGIIIIKANTITNGGTFTITANGIDQVICGASDGQGGGGGGGSILLSAGTITNAIPLVAKGGKGGNHSNDTCHGGGGGGGGGVVCYSAGAGASFLSVNVTGGRNGRQQAGSMNPTCSAFPFATYGETGDACDWGATSGATGVTCSNLVFNQNSCGLPVTLISFFAQHTNPENVQLHWKTASEKNTGHFEIQRSPDGLAFSIIGTVSAAGNSMDEKAYSFMDYDASSVNASYIYYRLKITDTDGASYYSDLVAVNVSVFSESSISCFPNPVQAGENVTLDFVSGVSGTMHVRVINFLGAEVITYIYETTFGENKINLPTAGLLPGTYLLLLDNTSEINRRKLFIE